MSCKPILDVADYQTLMRSPKPVHMNQMSVWLVRRYPKLFTSWPFARQYLYDLQSKQKHVFQWIVLRFIDEHFVIPQRREYKFKIRSID